MPEVFTALTPAQANSYVRRGFRFAHMTPVEWAAQFRRIGGESCVIRPFGLGLAVTASGTPGALAMVELTVASL